MREAVYILQNIYGFRFEMNTSQENKCGSCSTSNPKHKNVSSTDLK